MEARTGRHVSSLPREEEARLDNWPVEARTGRHVCSRPTEDEDEEEDEDELGTVKLERLASGDKRYVCSRPNEDEEEDEEGASPGKLASGAKN